MHDKGRWDQRAQHANGVNRRRFLEGSSVAAVALASGPLSLLTSRPGAAQAQNKTLEALMPDPAVPLQNLGAEARPLEERMLRTLKEVDVQTIEGVEKEMSFAQGTRKSVRSIVWTCATNRGNRLTYGGSPFLASIPPQRRVTTICAGMVCFDVCWCELGILRSKWWIVRRGEGSLGRPSAP